MYSLYSMVLTTFIIDLPSDIKLTKGLVKVLHLILSCITKFEGLVLCNKGFVNPTLPPFGGVLLFLSINAGSPLFICFRLKSPSDFPKLCF